MTNTERRIRAQYEIRLQDGWYWIVRRGRNLGGASEKWGTRHLRRSINSYVAYDLETTVRQMHDLRALGFTVTPPTKPI
jgi:hypothetical protein